MMSNPGDQGHTWKRLKVFAELLGPNFNHEDESRLLAAFQDFVYFMNFGWDSLESLLQDQSQSEEENQSVPGHESSFDCDGNDIYVEDILNICRKLKSRNGNGIVTIVDESIDVSNDVLVASPLFIHGVAAEDWIRHVAEKCCFAVPSLGFGLSHINITTLPGIANSSSRRIDTNIHDEHLISIAKRAGCFSLHRDCYDHLRKISRDYLAQVLRTTFTSLNCNCRNLLMANDIQQAIMFSNRLVICGYGFKGLKRVFYHEILGVVKQAYPAYKIDCTAVEVVSDMLCHLLDKLMRATPRTIQSHRRLPAVPVQVDSLCFSNSTCSVCAMSPPAFIVKTRGSGNVNPRPFVVEQLMTCHDVNAGLDKTMFLCEQLVQHARSEGARATSKLWNEFLKWDDGMLKVFFLGFIPEKVAALAKEWYNVTFEDEALLFATAVLEYICTEIMELSGNSATNNSGSVISSRDILLAVENDAELCFLFRGCVLRDGGSVANSTLLTFSEESEAGVDGGVNGEVRAKSYHESSSQELRNRMDDSTPIMDDAYTGFPIFPRVDDDIPLRIDCNSYMSSGLSRMTRRNNAVLRACDDGTALQLLMKEVPLDTSAHALDCLDFTKLRNAVVVSEGLVAANTCPDIPRTVLKNIIAELCSDPEFADHEVWKFTHEAINVLQLGLERYLLEVLRESNAKVVCKGLAVIEPSDIMEAVGAHQLLMAAKSQNRRSICRLLRQGVNVDSTFKGDSAMMVACDNDEAALMTWLIEHGASVNITHRTPFMVNAERPNCVLLRAMQEERKKIFALLLRRFSDKVDFAVHSKQGQNALMWFAQSKDCDDPDLIERLVSQRGIDINAKDGEGRTAFELACHEEYIAAEKLILLGAEVEKKFIDKLRASTNKNRLLAAMEAVATCGLK